MGRVTPRQAGVLALFFVTLFVPAREALAQNPTFNVEGVVTDAQQAVLPGVAVTITNTATGLTRTVTTGDNGRYVVRALRPKVNIVCKSRSPASRRRCGRTWSSTPARTWC